MKLQLMTCFLITSFAATVLHAEEKQRDEPKWGNLSGRIVFDGEALERKKIKVERDKEVFGDSIEDESLIVNKVNRGIANVIIYLLPAKDEEPKVHPSFEKREKVTLAMDGGKFVPHVLLMQTGQTMVEVNRDKVAHNVQLNSRRNSYSPLISPTPLAIKMESEEVLPIAIACNVYPWMRAYLLVRSNPYMTVTDADGKFAIKNLPSGKHEFQFWHERIGYLKDVDFGEHKTNHKGRLTLEISEGKIELKPASMKPEVFEPAAE